MTKIIINIIKMSYSRTKAYDEPMFASLLVVKRPGFNQATLFLIVFLNANRRIFNSNELFSEFS